mgnify:CR=1 FL=1
MKKNMTMRGAGMLEQKFEIVYTKFKLHFYQEIFERFQNREASLTTVETFAMETIQAPGLPNHQRVRLPLCASRRPTRPIRSTA